MHRRLNETPRSVGQAMVEFLLIVPLIVVLVLGIIEVARIIHGFLGIGNAARYGVRYAVTGEWGLEECESLFGGDCTDSGQEQDARVATVAKVAMQGSSLIYIDEMAEINDPGFFQVTTCSYPGTIIAPSSPSDVHRCVDENGDPFEYAGDPGEYVVVVVDYNFPFITPFFNQAWSHIHLSSTRLARVEDFRTSRPEPPPPIVTRTETPEITATLDQTATCTPTPSQTAILTSTPTPSQTATLTPTPSPTADCGWIIDGPLTYDETNHRFELHLGNASLQARQLTKTSLEWSKRWESEYLDWMEWNGTTYYSGDDYEGPTVINIDPALAFPILTNIAWFGDLYADDPPGPLLDYTIDYILTLTFDNGCEVVKQHHFDYPTPTPGPTPDCGDIVVTDVRVNGDDFEIEVSNQTLADFTLWDATIDWPESLGMHIHMFSWRGLGYDFNQYYSSPTTSQIANRIFPANYSSWFEVDFDNVPIEGLWGYFKGDLRFFDPNNGFYCSVSTDHTEPQPPTPTPTNTATITSTPSITPTPTNTQPATNTPPPINTPEPTNTPSTNPDCSKLVVNNVQFNGDDFEFNVRNDNTMPAYLTNSTLYFPVAVPMQFNEKKFNTVMYYTTNSYFSPVNASAPSMLLAAGTNRLWEADFNFATFNGTYQAVLTFEFPGWGTCQVSGIKTTGVENTATPTNTPPPAATNTPTPTNTSPPVPTNTSTPTATPIGQGPPD